MVAPVVRVAAAAQAATDVPAVALDAQALAPGDATGAPAVAADALIHVLVRVTGAPAAVAVAPAHVLVRVRVDAPAVAVDAQALAPGHARRHAGPTDALRIAVGAARRVGLIAAAAAAAAAVPPRVEAHVKVQVLMCEVGVC